MDAAKSSKSMADKRKLQAGDAKSEVKIDKTKGNKETDKDQGKQKEAGKESKRKASKGKIDAIPEVEEIPKTESQLLAEEAEYRALLRRQRFKRQWPAVTKVKINTRPWTPPPPPQRMPPVTIELPELTMRRWVPPHRRRRRQRPRLPRIPPEQITQPLYESAKLKKIWHSFVQVDRNKMMLQGTVGCDSKKYSSTACGSQTGCIAVVCRALLHEKATSELVRQDVDEVIDAGDKYYHQCMVALKCYKGKPQLELKQLLTSFFFHDAKYTVKMNETDQGILAKHPENLQAGPDLMALMEKRVGTSYMCLLTVGDKHFLIWGEPPEAGSQCKTVCYIFDPHMLNEIGQRNKLEAVQDCGCGAYPHAAGAFLRYAGVTSFVMDFLANYGDLDAAKRTTPKPPIALTNIEVVQREPLIREPRYELDLKALHIHCRSEWESIHMQSLIDKKRYQGQYPLESLSAVSIATSRATPKRKMMEFYQKTPKERGVRQGDVISPKMFTAALEDAFKGCWTGKVEAAMLMPLPTLPMAPEKAPPGPTYEQLMSLRGEDFFLYCPRTDGHTYGRDDMIPRPKSEVILHSAVEIADQNYHSQFQQLDVEKWILRGTRHMASYRYQTFKSYTAIPCCVAALAMLQRLRARAWNEDTLDETLDLGYNLYRESLLERGGPIRRLVLGELKDNFRIRDKEYFHKEKGIAVWGKIVSNNPKVFDLCRGIEYFFKESDSGILQIPGEYETAIWNEGGKFYLYHPWPADRYGKRVGLRDGGRACVLCFSKVARLCEYFIDSAGDLKRKPFSISDVFVKTRPAMPEPINELKPVAPGRWVVRGSFHEGDSRFPEEHRNKQATPTAITAIALAHVVPTNEWTKSEVDEALIRGDILYQNTMEHLERMGISLEMPKPEEGEGEEEETAVTGTLAAADVMNRFRVTDFDCIETEVVDSAYSGTLSSDTSSGVMSLKESLKQLFKEYNHAVITARGGSMAVWREDGDLYMFDPHGCDDSGYPSDDMRAAACLIRIGGSTDALAAAIEGNLSPGADDSFNLSPVLVTPTKLNPEIGAPETNLESKAFEWIRKGTAAIMMGPRGENSAIGKAATKANIGDEDKAGRTIALPAAAAFCAASVSVPPPHMHQDHMFNFLDAGADYYQQLVKKTGNKDVMPEDLTEKFEMGANTFSIELEEPTRLPLRLPDAPVGEGEEEAAEKELLGEGEEQPETLKEMKDLLFKWWYDQTKPAHVGLLVGDYHQLGVWLAPGGKVVAFDPAPTLMKGMLTSHRIQKGDELRLQRIKDEMAGEGGGGDAEEEEVGGEGEEKPEPEPEPVPKESSPTLMVFASPGEFIDKLTQQGGLDKKQCLAPYKLYPVKVINELTSLLREKRPPPKGGEGDEAAGEEDEEALVEALDDAAMGKYMNRLSRTAASVRGRIAQHENYFQEVARDNQDAAMSVIAIVVDHIEPYNFWKPPLIDAIVKYGDRLYTTSLPNASKPPRVRADECPMQFHLTSFNVKLEMEPNIVEGDFKAGPTGSVKNLPRGITKFFENYKYGVLCAKDYCVALWRAQDEKAYCMYDPHSVGPAGRTSSTGGAGLIVYSTIEELAETFKANVELLTRPGNNKYTIISVKVFWEFAKRAEPVTPQGAVPDEGYEWKVLTAFVETARGRTVLRGSRPPDVVKFTRDALLQSSCGAIVAVCMSHVRRSHLWTKKTVDMIMAVACQLFSASLGNLGYEFRPGEDLLMPLQVLKRFVLGVNYVRYDLQAVYSGKLEQIHPSDMSVRAALERFFECHSHGVLWSPPHAVGVWRVQGAPPFYMMEPHACGPTGLRVDAQDDGAACVLTFTSPKLMAYAYLQNVPVTERPRHEFHLYAMSVQVAPIKKMAADPPLVRAPPGARLVPATSKVGVTGEKRRAREEDRKHPPGGPTCKDAQRVADAMEKESKDPNLKGQRNTSGWLVLADGTQFLSAAHSMACRKFTAASRGNQALACSVMAVAMSRVEDVCRWCSTTLDAILASGDQLYQDSYLHYKPGSKILAMEQILRKFYTPGNCVCRVVVYEARQTGTVDLDLVEKLTEFFREEKCGVFVAGRGDVAVALFRTPRGYYMFDPADRDRYGRAVPPPCIGRARACFSQYPNVQTLADKLCPNIPPMIRDEELEVKENTRSPSQQKLLDEHEKHKLAKADGQVFEPLDLDEPTDKPRGEEKEVHFEEPATFKIYGMDVTSLRRLNQHEK